MRRPRSHALLAVATLVLLLVAVAAASTGSIPAGSASTRRPSGTVVDMLLSLFLVAMAGGVALWAYVLLIRKDVVAEAAAARRRRSPWASALGLAVSFGLLALFVRWLSVDESLRRRISGRIDPQIPSGPGKEARASTYSPHFATVPVAIVLSLLAIVGIALYVSHRSSRRPLDEPARWIGPALLDVLDETLDDLRGEADPRRAVIAAYARMERALAAYGLPRRAAEAPDEYLRRIFDELDVGRRASARLTALFATAKFSAHDVGPEMKQEAIGALESVREELRAAELMAEIGRGRNLPGARRGSAP